MQISTCIIYHYNLKTIQHIIFLIRRGFILNKADTETKNLSVSSLGVSEGPRDFGLAGCYCMMVQFHHSPFILFSNITCFSLLKSITYTHHANRHILSLLNLPLSHKIELRTARGDSRESEKMF